MAWGASAGVDERYRPMVARLEREAMASPTRYARRVAAAALLGYGFIFVVMAVLIGIIAAMVILLFTARSGAAVEIKVAFVCALVAFAIMRALAVKLDPIEGRRLTAEDAPALFALIERLRTDTGGPQIDEVVVNADFNAAIVQQPRFAVVGSRNTLILGLPLTKALSEAEFAAVIAHELGHFVGSHGRWSAFVYLVRMRWLQLSERLPGGWTAGILRRFFGWYGPWFNAYSFALARSQEYEADRIAGRATSPATAGDALIRVCLQAGRFDNGWSTVWAEAAHRATPSAMPYRSIDARLAEDGDDSAAMLIAALNVRTGLDDTHPSLADRLAALNHDPAPLTAVDRSAAVALLGSLADTLADELDREWWDANGDWWVSLHEGWKSEAAEMAELGCRLAEGAPLDRKQRQRHAELVRDMEGDLAAIPHFRALLDAFPDAPVARYQFGDILLATGAETEGIAEFERAWLSWPSLATPAMRTIIYHLVAADRADEAEPWHERLAEAEARDVIADAEFREVAQQDVLDPLDLTPADRAALSQGLAEIPDLRHIHAARRTLRYGDRDQIVFTFAVGKGGDGQFAIDAIGILMLDHGDTLGFQRTSKVRWLERKLKKVPGSELYRRRA